MEDVTRILSKQEKLDAEMSSAADQVLASAKHLKRLLPVKAQATRIYYLNLVKEGFTEEQALELTKMTSFFGV